VRVKIRLSIAAAALLLASLASSQNAPVPVQIDDNGVVIPAHQQRHVKNGQVIAWSRTTAGGPWLVRFTRSPCANGVTVFGSGAGQPRTCTVTARCTAAGNANCVYHYSSATGANQPAHDPDVIVDMDGGQ
jgi:hypothetical protein